MCRTDSCGLTHLSACRRRPTPTSTLGRSLRKRLYICTCAALCCVSSLQGRRCGQRIEADVVAARCPKIDRPRCRHAAHRSWGSWWPPRYVAPQTHGVACLTPWRAGRQAGGFAIGHAWYVYECSGAPPVPPRFGDAHPRDAVTGRRTGMARCDVSLHARALNEGVQELQRHRRCRGACRVVLMRLR